MLSRKNTIGTIGYMGGIPAIPEPFVWSWTQMLQFTESAICQDHEQIAAVRAQYSFHSMARNELVSKLQGDWLLQLDCDMVFDPDFAARLVMTMERYKLDIVTGLYCYKNHPEIPTLYMFNKANGLHEPLAKWDDECEVFEVDSAGAGCLLVRRSVYERMVQELHQPPFEVIPPYGEDHSFFMRARQLGIKAYCAWKVQAAHLGYKQVIHTPDRTLQVLNEYGVTAYGTRKGEIYQ